MKNLRIIFIITGSIFLCYASSYANNFSRSRNYMLTVTPLSETSEVTISGNTITTDAGAQFLTVVQYTDGMGRPEQEVFKGFTPQKADLVCASEYDKYGRPYKQWLPLPVKSNHGAFVPVNSSFESKIGTHYGDPAPVYLTNYEASPLERIREEFGPGINWHTNMKCMRTDVFTNTTSGVLACGRYEISGNNLIRRSNYAAAMLFVTRYTDEDECRYYEFKDKTGLLLLSRQVDGNVFHDTYYVYDASGNLCYVLPPLAADATTINKTYTPNDESIMKYSYVYQYDNHNRCIRKRLPGTGWTYMVYNRRGEVVLTQDALQREKKQWHHFRYDALGRLVLSDLVTEYGRTHEHLMAWFQVLAVTIEKGNGSYGYDFNGEGLYGPGIAQQVCYYDDYDYILSLNSDFRSKLSYEEKSGYGKRFINNEYPEIYAMGYLAGQRVFLPDGTGEVASAMYYDKKGNLIQRKSTNHLGGLVKEYFFLYFYRASKTASGNNFNSLQYGIRTLPL